MQQLGFFLPFLVAEFSLVLVRGSHGYVRVAESASPCFVSKAVLATV
jgi:hypothetical protein